MKTFHSRLAVAGALLVICPSLAFAQVCTTSPCVVDLAGAGAFSCDGPGAPCNFTVDVDFGGDALLTGLGWDVTIDTVGASWLSEAVTSFQDSSSVEQFTLTPGAGDAFPGTKFYSSGGIVDLEAALGFTPEFDDGILRLEFYESFDDVAGAIDAFYLEPSFLTLQWELDALLEISKSYRHTNVCFERDNDGDGQLSEDGPDGVDNDLDGLIDEDASECPDGTSPGDEIENDGEGTYLVESVVKKNGQVASYNPGQLYALVTVNVLADIDELNISELYTDCTEDPPDLLDLNPKNGGGRAVVVVEHPDGTLEQVFDANVDDPNVIFESDEDSTSVSWSESFEADDIIHLFVKFGPGQNSTGDGSCTNAALAATPAGDDSFEALAEATLIVAPND